MTQEDFKNFTEIVIPSALFHVDKNDLDDSTGGKLEEVILIKCLNDYPSALKFKPLSWFIETYL